MVKDKIKSEPISDDVVIIDAYIIDELITSNLNHLEETTALLPNPRYHVTQEETEYEQRVIIIEL